MQLVFQRVSLDDIHLLDDVADDIFDHPIDFGFARQFLADARNILIVALHGTRVIGQLVAIVHHHLDAPTDLFIENLGVSQEWRRRGIARRLLSLAAHAGAAQGARSAWVATERDNEPANRLYAATGASSDQFVMFSYATL